jgi:hypothetical protein
MIRQAVRGGHRAIRILVTWMMLAFMLHLVWEVAQLPLYTLVDDSERVRIAVYVLHCTSGDVLIAMTTFLVPALAWRRIDWYRAHALAGSVLMIGLALAYTAGSEFVNVYRWGRWAYASSMPVIGGIGIAPLLQWIIVPGVMVTVMRLRTSAIDRV